MNTNNLSIKVNKMKKLIKSLVAAYLLLLPTFSMAEHIAFGPIVVDRSRIMISIEQTAKDKLKLEAAIGGMTGKMIKIQCRITDKTPPAEKVLTIMATHLNESKMTSLETMASEAGLTECK
jgi:hypothetical protein